MRKTASTHTIPSRNTGGYARLVSLAVKFKDAHGCRLTCAMGEKLIPLFRDAYPDIDFVTHERCRPSGYYATYSVGLFFDDKDAILQPCDFRHVGLHRTAGYILGVTRPKSRSADRPCRLNRGRSQSRMYALQCKARRNANIGIIHPAGESSSNF